MFGVSSTSRWFIRLSDFLQNIDMRWHQSFWGPEVAHFGPLDGALSIDLEVPFFLDLSSVVALL